MDISPHILKKWSLTNFLNDWSHFQALPGGQDYHYISGGRGQINHSDAPPPHPHGWDDLSSGHTRTYLYLYTTSADTVSTFSIPPSGMAFNPLLLTANITA